MLYTDQEKFMQTNRISTKLRQAIDNKNKNRKAKQNKTTIIKRNIPTMHYQHPFIVNVSNTGDKDVCLLLSF